MLNVNLDSTHSLKHAAALTSCHGSFSTSSAVFKNLSKGHGMVLQVWSYVDRKLSITRLQHQHL